MRRAIHLDEFEAKHRPTIDAMKSAEERTLQEARAAGDALLRNQTQMRSPTRRQVLAGATAMGGAAAAAALMPRSADAAAPPGAVEYPVPDDPSKVLGRGIGEDGGYGTRSQFESEVRWRYATPTTEASWSMTPLANSIGIITPSGLHFERHHAGIPTIDPQKHELIVHGMVNKAMKYSMEDLKRFPSISRHYFIECSGNTFGEWQKAKLKTVQASHGLVSTAEWTGVPVSTILREVGVKEGAAWVLFEAADGSVMTRSIPLAKCWKDALLAYGQNGEAIRPEQGYPLRVILPGWEGNTHIKWLRRIEISDKPFMTREETSKYTDHVGGGKARQFTFIMEAKSVITFPSGEMQLPRPGFYEISGLAWSGRGRITRVEVSTDGGMSWRIASLQWPVLPLCHTRFSFPWQWDGKPAVLQSRCQDESGYIQPTIKQLVDVRTLEGGPLGSIYHMNGIQSWGVANDGSVKNANHM